MLAVHREHWPISEFEPCLTNLDGEAGRMMLTVVADQRTRPGFQGWTIRTNPVTIIFDYDC
jgi:hypothetical protein